MDVATSTFKIKLLKALATPKTLPPPPPSPPKVVLKSSWIICDPGLITSTKVGRGEGPCYYLGQKILRIFQKMHFFKCIFVG